MLVFLKRTFHANRCVNFLLSIVSLLTRKDYLKKKQTRDLVKKAANILILTAVILVTTVSHLQLWQCLINGELLLNPECTIKTVTCCSMFTENETVITDIDCCEKILVTNSFTMEKVDSSLTAKERKVIDFDISFLSGLRLSDHLQSTIDYFNNLPPPGLKVTPNTTPKHISLCSFTC